MPDIKYIKRITIPGDSYEIWDEGAREQIKEISEIIAGGITFIVAWDGVSTPVPANIPAGVKVKYGDTEYTGTLSAETSKTATEPHAKAGAFYLVASRVSGQSTVDNFAEYVPVGGDGSKTWEKIGNTSLHDLDAIQVNYAKASNVNVVTNISGAAVDSGTVNIDKGTAIKALTGSTTFETSVTPSTTYIKANRSTDAALSTSNGSYVNGINHTVKYLTTSSANIPSITTSKLDTATVQKYTVSAEKSSYISANNDVVASYITGFTNVSVPSVTAGSDVTASYISAVSTDTIKGVASVTAKTASYVSAVSTTTGHLVTANESVTASYVSAVSTTSISGNVMAYADNAKNWAINYNSTTYTLDFSYGLFGSVVLPSTVVTGVTTTDIAASKITSTASSTFVTGVTTTDIAASEVTATTDKTIVTGITKSEVTANKTTLGTATNVKSIAWEERTASKITSQDTAPSKVTENGTQAVAVGTVSASGSGASIATGTGDPTSITFATGALDTTSTSNGAVETDLSYTTGSALTAASISAQPVFTIASGATGDVNVATGITSASTSATGTSDVMSYSASAALASTTVTVSKTTGTAAADDAVSYTSKITLSLKQA